MRDEVGARTFFIHLLINLLVYLMDMSAVSSHTSEEDIRSHNGWL